MAKELVIVDLAMVGRQAFSESTLKEHGGVWHVTGDATPFPGAEMHLWEQYQRFRQQFAEWGKEASEQAQAIGSRLVQIDLRQFKCPWNVHYASHEPERLFSELLFEHAEMFDAFVKMPNQGGYAFPYSYKPARTGKTHVTNEHFNPDFFIRLKESHTILVVEIKAEGDDSNRNRAKCRDGLRHFETLNARLTETGEPWRYHFYFLSPDDFTQFFAAVQREQHVGWRSGLMQELVRPDSR
jgi:type III restriction enzyme